MYWYTILEAGNIGPEGRDDTETKNRILPDLGTAIINLLQDFHTNTLLFIPTILSMKLNRRPQTS